MTLEAQIEHLRQHGSSLDLNWGEDTGCWEVAWITGGVRYVGVCRDLGCALATARDKAEKAIAR